MCPLSPCATMLFPVKHNVSRNSKKLFWIIYVAVALCIFLLKTWGKHCEFCTFNASTLLHQRLQNGSELFRQLLVRVILCRRSLTHSLSSLKLGHRLSQWLGCLACQIPCGFELLVICSFGLNQTSGLFPLTVSHGWNVGLHGLKRDRNFQVARNMEQWEIPQKFSWH
jgi:hypothetical protein